MDIKSASSGTKKRGWGSIRVQATINAISWKTSIFPDKQRGAYILPIKADVRKKAQIGQGDAVTCTLVIQH